VHGILLAKLEGKRPLGNLVMVSNLKFDYTYDVRLCTGLH
jgi:hypothetical protein